MGIYVSLIGIGLTDLRGLDPPAPSSYGPTVLRLNKVASLILELDFGIFYRLCFVLC